MGKPAALDLSVTSPLNPPTLLEAGVTAGAAAKATEERKLKANTGKCADLGISFPNLGTSLGKSKSVVTHEQLYGRMSMNLVRANATAILSSVLNRGKNCTNITMQAWAVLTTSTYSKAVAVFNTQVSLSNTITVNSVQDSPIPQKVLSGMIQAQYFHILLESSSPANRARLLSVAAPHASSWLSVVPSPGLGLHLESNEYQMAIWWWLGVGLVLAVETYGNWGKEAHDTFSRLASYLDIHQPSPKSAVVAEIYSRLNIALVRSIARAILTRELLPS
eukprot:Em0019g925a